MTCQLHQVASWISPTPSLRWMRLVSSVAQLTRSTEFFMRLFTFGISLAGNGSSLNPDLQFDQRSASRLSYPSSYSEELSASPIIELAR